MNNTWTDWVVVALIIGSVPAATLFPIVYGLTAPWWRSLLGRALLVKSIAVALLLDLSLMIRVLQVNDTAADVMRLTIMVLIFLGVNMQFTALLTERHRARRDHRGDAFLS